MRAFNGSSALSEEQQQFFVGKFGERYLRVQEVHPDIRASRRERRRRQFRPRSERP